ncbi:uncharacterized protein LOC134239300, partial [Saccostrea cucullata]|uniref:uncharacterized protein LOC134239300 n=1 Tax=Saccostrea cuccullata TaxID=36930 RepID=UPI002ED61349
MSSQNVTQCIEKETLKHPIRGLWRNEDQPECDSNEEVVFENCLKEKLLNVERLSTASNVIPDEQKREDVDKIDYFDSEDEYWENYTFTTEDDFHFDEFENGQGSPSSRTRSMGRYSQGVEQYHNMPVFRRSIQKFATDNNFDVYDVISDGNCMFRAIADQLLINGCLGHSIESLRHTAIKYLGQNPFHQDKGHLSSFLSEETWEEYLTRMSKSGEWSDHIILQAVADVFSLEVIVFNVYRDDICRTEVKGKMCKNNQNRLTIFLGHLGEFHYLSLRPKLWLRHWPYKVLILRILACTKEIDSDTKRHFIAQQVKRMNDERFIPETTLQEVANFALHKIDEDEGEDDGMEVKYTNNREWTRVFRPYIQMGLQSGETEGSIQYLTEDGMQIDSLTGIPIIHLSFIMKILLSQTLKKIRFLIPQGYLLYIEEHREIMFYHFIGPACDPCYFTMKDITRSQKMSKLYNERHLKKPRIVIIRKDKSVLFAVSPEKENSISRLYVDTSGSHPGYCRIKLQIYCRDDNILQIGSNVYLKAYEVPERIKTVPHFHQCEVQYIGFQCPFPPMTSQWREKKRNYDFPSAVLIDRARGRKVTLIPKAHPRSENPTIEWKFDFSLAEFTMFTNLTKAQQYGYFVIKVLIENMTSHLNKTLKRKHLKAVFLNAAEEKPSSAWDTCFSSCILHVISKLLTCLKTGFLSHYFIPSNNLFDSFSEADIN